MKRMIVSTRDPFYFGRDQYEKYGNLVSRELSGMIISKRFEDADEPGGIEYEAEQLGIDVYELLRCLEGMRMNGLVEEISDYQYKVL